MTRTPSPLLLGAMLLTAASLLPAATAAAQEPGPGPGLDRLDHLLMTQLVAVWTQMLQGVSQDPQFLTTAEGQALLQRQQALTQVRLMMMEALRAPQPRAPEGGGPGTFDFVTWIELDRRYWVLDTRTGLIYARDSPPPPRDEGPKNPPQ